MKTANGDPTQEIPEKVVKPKGRTLYWKVRSSATALRKP